MCTQCPWLTCRTANSVLFEMEASFHMTFVLATGQLTWHVSSWSGLEYVYYHKVQHPFLQQ